MCVKEKCRQTERERKSRTWAKYSSCFCCYMCGANVESGECALLEGGADFEMIWIH